MQCKKIFRKSMKNCRIASFLWFFKRFQFLAYLSGYLMYTFHLLDSGRLFLKKKTFKIPRNSAFFIVVFTRRRQKIRKKIQTFLQSLKYFLHNFSPWTLKLFPRYLRAIRIPFSRRTKAMFLLRGLIISKYFLSVLSFEGTGSAFCLSEMSFLVVFSASASETFLTSWKSKLWKLRLQSI